MYESFYGFQQKPFSQLPDSKFFFIGKKHRKTLTKLVFGVRNQVGITLVTGDVGCGKTTLIRYLKNQLENQITVGVLNNTQYAFGNLMQWILQVFNVKVSDTGDVHLHRAFLEFVKGEFAKQRNVLLIVDEAQNLSVQDLEELRLLTNVSIDDRMFQVVLVGQLKLRELLRHPEVGYLTQRIAVEYRLSPLDLDQTEEYIRYRLKLAGGDPEIFDFQACDLIYAYSRGIPRLINSICDAALMYGYDKQQNKIDGALMMEVVSEEDASKMHESGMLLPIALERDTADKEAMLLPNASSNQVHYGNITVIKDGDIIDNFIINGTCMTIGRGQDNDIYLPDEKISRHHARIIRNSGGYYLEDLTSTNGTYVNAQRVIGYTLQDGDVVNIGKFSLCYSSSEAYEESSSKTNFDEVAEASPSFTQIHSNQAYDLDNQANDLEFDLEDESSAMFQEETPIKVSEKKQALGQSALMLSDKKSDLLSDKKRDLLSDKKRDLDDVLETLSDYLDDK